MASYDAWNRAIIERFTQGVARGSAIYLSLDDDVLAQIATVQESLGVVPDEAGDDFARAVRNRVVLEGRRISLSLIEGRTKEGMPKGVAFLASMVLAASNMADEDQESGRIDEKDFFRRVRAILRLENVVGRPDGLPAGSEEPLWHEWNQWLSEQELLSTARSGEGPHRFTAYPISQTLLRKADKDRLRSVFSGSVSRWQMDLDGETLLIQLRTWPELQRRSRYLLDRLNRPGPRYQALSDLLFDLHEAWRANPGATSRDRLVSRVLRCGLYRDVDSSMGTVDYLLYPRTPAGREARSGSLRQGGLDLPLRVDRAGWYEPLDPISAAELSDGAHFEVAGIDGIANAVLPARTHWVLVPDPEEPESGRLASWRHPGLGEPATVLITRERLRLLENLKSEGFITWRGEPAPAASLPGWYEVRECLVISEALGGLFGDEQELFEELRPASRLGITTSGGLRSPDRRGWIAGMGPDITVSGFDDEVNLRIIRMSSAIREQIILDRVIPSQTSTPFPDTAPGAYRVEVSAAGNEAARPVTLVDWDHLESLAAPDYSSVGIGGWDVLGATMRKREGVE